MTARSRMPKNPSHSMRRTLFITTGSAALMARKRTVKRVSFSRKVKKEFEEAVRVNPSDIAARRRIWRDYCISAPWIVGGNKDEAREQADAIAAIDPIDGHVARAALYLDGMKRPELAENGISADSGRQTG